MSETFDFIVVGAGSAGSVLADRLTENGKHSVLLLEAGGKDSNPWIHIPAGMSKILPHQKLNWHTLTEPCPGINGRRMPIHRGRVLGGSSSINGMIYTRGQPQDFDQWAEEGNDGWAWEDVLPYFKKEEDYHGGQNDVHGAGGRLKVSQIEPSSSVTPKFLDAAVAAGIPINKDVNSGEQEGVYHSHATVENGRRCSTSRAYLKFAQSRPNLEIRTGVLVQKLLFEANRITGVSYLRDDGTEAIAQCTRETIVSAGAFGSPQVLQLSGIGDPDELKRVGITPLHALKGVGRNLQDHLFAHLKARLHPQFKTLNQTLTSTPKLAVEVFRWLLFRKGAMCVSSSEINGFFRSSPGLNRPDLQLAFRPYSFSVNEQGAPEIDSYPAFTASAIQLRPHSTGTVYLHSVNPKDQPKIQPNYLDVEEDLHCLVRGLKRVRDVIGQSPLKEMIAAEVHPGPGLKSDEELGAYVRASASTVYHPVGTCKMGSGDDAVVDKALKVHGVEGLRVVDASIMPTITSGNTNAPSIMIGEKGADLLLQDHAA